MTEGTGNTLEHAEAILLGKEGVHGSRLEVLSLEHTKNAKNITFATSVTVPSEPLTWKWTAICE